MYVYIYWRPCIDGGPRQITEETPPEDAFELYGILAKMDFIIFKKIMTDLTSFILLTLDLRMTFFALVFKKKKIRFAPIWFKYLISRSS